MHQGWEAPKNVVVFYLKLFPDADYRIRQRAWWWAALSGTACMALSPFNFPPFPFAMKRLICCILLLLILRNTYYVGGILRKKTRAYFTGSNFFHFTKKKFIKRNWLSSRLSKYWSVGLRINTNHVSMAIVLKAMTLNKTHSK